MRGRDPLSTEASRDNLMVLFPSVLAYQRPLISPVDSRAHGSTAFFWLLSLLTGFQGQQSAGRKREPSSKGNRQHDQLL